MFSLGSGWKTHNTHVPSISMMTFPTDPVEWYRGQVIFLTGATGNLGGCLLYKLTVKLPVEKVYVICRGSMRQAMEKWEASMPEQIDEILDSGKFHCFTGDVTQPKFGLGTTELEILEREVTVVIHAAANFSLFQGLPATIHDNCLPVVALARMLHSFHKIKIFLHVSSISTQSFLPGGSVLESAEHISPGEDTPEKQMEDILATGQSPYTERFMAPYAQAKYLAEQFLLKLRTSFPILIVRPTSIGPAIEHPYPLYGPEGAIPIHTFFQLLLEGGNYRSLDELKTIPQNIIVDEIPVDLACNICLLHLAAGSNGIVHAGSQLYVPITFGQYINQLQRHAPRPLVEKVTQVRLEKNIHFSSQATDMLKRICREWSIDCERSRHLKDTEGPIGLSIPGHDFQVFSQKRIERRARNMELWIDTLNSQGPQVAN